MKESRMTAEEMQKEIAKAEELHHDYNDVILASEDVGDTTTHAIMGAFAMSEIRHSWRQAAEICSRLDRIVEALERFLDRTP